ncbi:MAG: glyoxalase [Rhizobiales bacterium]|nr:glyoxalase [Hyphomicrobiales bacterium]
MRFDHVNIRSRDMEAMRSFLEEIVGLKPGARPDFPFPGYWLYAGDQAVVHMIEWKEEEDLHAGPVDHIAFGTFDFDEKRAELDATGHKYRVADVPGLPLKQIFVEGPEGVTLELQCPTN